jgi:hypothetical protein
LVTRNVVAADADLFKALTAPNRIGIASRRHLQPLGTERESDMKNFLIAALVSVFAVGSAMAQEPTCESKAVGKDGKALAGAAKTSFMKKCKAEACEPKAVGSDGKKLTGAAKASFMKKCQAGA